MLTSLEGGFDRGGRSPATLNERPLNPGSQELAPPYFLLLRAIRAGARETISDTSQCAVSTNHLSLLTNHYSPQGLGRGVGRPLGVGTDLGVGVGLGVGVAVGVGVGVGVAVGVGVGVTVGVGVGVALGDAVGVGVGVGACPPGNTRT